MPHRIIEEEINLKDVEDIELIAELEYRNLDREAKERLHDVIGKEIIKEAVEKSIQFKVKTIDDKMKVDHLQKVWQNYTVEQIENLLP